MVRRCLEEKIERALNQFPVNCPHSHQPLRDRKIARSQRVGSEGLSRPRRGHLPLEEHWQSRQDSIQVVGEDAEGIHSRQRVVMPFERDQNLGATPHMAGCGVGFRRLYHRGNPGQSRRRGEHFLACRLLSHTERRGSGPRPHSSYGYSNPDRNQIWDGNKTLRLEFFGGIYRARKLPLRHSRQQFRGNTLTYATDSANPCRVFLISPTDQFALDKRGEA